MLACDGVWDVMSNQEVVQFVSVCLDSGMSLDSIASQLLDACLAPDPRETRGIGAFLQRLRLHHPHCVLASVLHAAMKVPLHEAARRRCGAAVWGRP